MKNFNKLVGLVFLLVAVIFALAACNDGVAPLAPPEDDGIVYVDDFDSDDVADYAEEYELSFTDVWDEEYQPQAPVFGSVTGEVVSIEDELGDLRIQIEGEDGATVFLTYFNTLTLGDAPEVGDTITGFYIIEPFMMAIYPPQHTASVIVNNDSFQEDGIPFIHVCRFYGTDLYGGFPQLISADGELVINLDTEIILQNGEPFDDVLVGRMMVVIYDMTTRSLPPQTTPIQIIVLYERAVTGPETIGDDWEGDTDVDPWYCIVIDGEGLVGAHAIFLDDEVDFQTHVELVPVAEHLGAEVEWNHDTNEVTLEGRIGSISFIVGSNDFVVNGETITLFHPAVDFYGSLYVPVLFFRDVFGMPTAYSFEGRIYIGSEESDMQ